MSAHAIIDILHYAKELKEAGVPPAQADIHAEKLAIIIDNNLATKADIKKVDETIKIEIKRIDDKFEALIRETCQKLINKIGGMIIVATSFLTAIHYFVK